jgi:hypothetical protein
MTGAALKAHGSQGGIKMEKTCECGKPIKNVTDPNYCDDCLELYDDRYKTEMAIEKAERDREGER